MIVQFYGIKCQRQLVLLGVLNSKMMNL